MRLSVLIPLVSVFLALTGSVEAVHRIPIPEGVQSYRFASAVDGPEAAWINPAALGQYQDFIIQYIGEYFDGGFSENWGYVISDRGAGIAYRKLDGFLGKDYLEYIFAGGAGVCRQGYIGGSYRYIKDGAGIYDKRHFWNVGLLFCRNPQWSLAAVFSNLNRGRVDDARTDIEQVYSVTYRQMHNRLRLSLAISLSTGQSMSSADYMYGAEFALNPKVTLYGNIDDDGDFAIGARVNLLRYTLGGQTRFDHDGNHLGSPLSISFYPLAK